MPAFDSVRPVGAAASATTATTTTTETAPADDAAWLAERELTTDEALLTRHDAALAAFKAKYEAALEEKRKKKLEAREMRENAARVVAAARASQAANKATKHR